MKPDGEQSGGDNVNGDVRDGDVRDDGAGRLFIGIPLTDVVRTKLRDHLQQHQGDVALPGRLVPPEKWHLTLRFLGGTSRDALGRLRASLAAAPMPGRFVVTFGALGAFPRESRATVLWLGLSDGADALGALAAKVEAAVQRAGFTAEPRAFSSHMTLSRVRPSRDLRALVAAMPPFREPMAVDAVVLFRSHLGRERSRYEEVERFGLEPWAGDASGATGRNST